jgi:hypothetical protein
LMYVEVDLTYTYYGGVSLATPIVNNRLSHHAHQKKRDFPKKAGITIAYGKYTASTHLHH